jgi:hypothetical protein
MLKEASEILLGELMIADPLPFKSGEATITAGTRVIERVTGRINWDTEELQDGSERPPLLLTENGKKVKHN